MKFVQTFFIIFTNHDVVVKINHQMNFSISFTNKLNFRLIKILKYIQKFNIIIKYKFEKQHVISNALF